MRSTRAGDVLRAMWRDKSGQPCWRWLRIMHEIAQNVPDLVWQTSQR